MGNKLYVGNLSFSCTEEQIKVLFAEAGTVTSVRIIADRDSGRSKGFGFVEMSNDTEANKAVEILNNRDLLGRAISVSEARPQAPREGGGGGGGFRGGGGGGGGGGFGGRRGGGR